MYLTLSDGTLKYTFAKELSILSCGKLQRLRFTCVINGVLTYFSLIYVLLAGDIVPF